MKAFTIWLRCKSQQTDGTLNGPSIRWVLVKVQWSWRAAKSARPHATSRCLPAAPASHCFHTSSLQPARMNLHFLNKQATLINSRDKTLFDKPTRNLEAIHCNFIALFVYGFLFLVLLCRQASWWDHDYSVSLRLTLCLFVPVATIF